MISDLDETIRRLLIDRAGLDPAEIDIRFEIPDRDWAASISRPTINCYLFDIHENRQLRAAGVWAEREGRTARVRKPPWRINLSYLITAWTKAVEDEHRLLWQVLLTLAQFSELPRDLLQGPLANIELEIPTSVAQPDGGPLRSPGEFWSALENKLKPSVNYVITLPLEVDAPALTPFVLSPLRILPTQLGHPPDGNGAGGGAAGPGGPGGPGGSSDAGGRDGDPAPGGGSSAGGAGGARSRRGSARQASTGSTASSAETAGTASANLVGSAAAVAGDGPPSLAYGPNTVREADGFTINGAVRDATGAIIKTARVYFLAAGGLGRPTGYRAGGFYTSGSRREGIGYGRGAGTEQSVITTCEGAFTLFTVPAGTHWVGVQVPGQPLRRCELTVPAATYDLVLDDEPSSAD